MVSERRQGYRDRVAEDPDVIGNDAAAEYVGVRPGTWRPYVKRHQAPQPYRREVTASGHALPVWHRSQLDNFKANRPGQGARTDLHRSAETDQS